MTSAHPPVSVSGTNMVSDRPAQCPACGRPVIRAEAPVTTPDEDAASAPRSVLVEPETGGPPVNLSSGLVEIVRSPVGRARVVIPEVHRVHVCPPGVFAGDRGAYGPPILAVPCPLDFCMVHPGELCLSARGEILARPHGARAEFAETMLATLPAPESETPHGDGTLPR